MEKIGYLGDSRSRKAAGVYQIKNLVNGKIYIGSSVTLSVRYSTHLKNLRQGTHVNPKLQSSWNKHGETSFEFSVLEYCDPKETFEMEQSYIDILKPTYNISLSVGVPNTPKAGTPEAMDRYLKVKNSIQKNGTYQSEKYLRMRSEIMNRMWGEDGYRESRSEETKELWNDPDYRRKQKHAHRKIDETNRVRIREMKEQGYKTCDIALAYQVSTHTVARILKGLH
jgi:group I intron endonuclease